MNTITLRAAVLCLAVAAPVRAALPVEVPGASAAPGVTGPAWLPGSTAPAGVPVWLQQDIVADDGAGDDRFGTSVAVSGDTAVVGAYDAKVGVNYSQGAAYVFTRQDGVWVQAQKLAAEDGASMANFGYALAFDGSTLLVSAISASADGNSNRGAVYVFVRTGNSWSQSQKLVASDGGSGDAFGSSLALSGSTALVGADGATVDGNALQGKAYVFALADGAWTQRQVLLADDGSGNDLFGRSVALQGDVALIGAPTLTYNFQHAGWVYVFQAVAGTWNQTGKIVPDDSAVGDQFGYAVGLSTGGALVSATGNQFAHGAVYAFDEAGASWVQTQKFSPQDSASGDEFGNALAVSGTSAVIGAERLDVDGHQGAAYFYTRTSEGWVQQRQFTGSAGTPLDFFGGSVAFDGSSVVVGIPGATVGDNAFQGAADVFAPEGGVPDDVFCDGFEQNATCAPVSR